ncbi:MAG: hypothetical protein K8I00_13150, partial [Candidatus Omnitrophica bacterium]|nr:hypothetical protein [Candidatus Omnitrophota bacterium]
MKTIVPAIFILIFMVNAGPALALPTERPGFPYLERTPGSHIRLTKFKKEQTRTGPDTKKRSILRKVNELQEDKKKREHYKKDKKRARDKRNDAGGIIDDETQRVRDEGRKSFRRKNSLLETRQNLFIDRYHEKKRSRDSY